MNALHIAALCVACFMAAVLVLNFWRAGGKKKNPDE
jgi:hypothetical protein